MKTTEKKELGAHVNCDAANCNSNGCSCGETCQGHNCGCGCGCQA